MTEPRAELAKLDDGTITKAIEPLAWELIKSRCDHMDHCATGRISADATLILSLVRHLVEARVSAQRDAPAVTRLPRNRSNIPWELDWSFLNKLHNAACSVEDGSCTHNAVEEVALAVERYMLDAQTEPNLRGSARDILDQVFSTYKARNGRDVGIEDDNGEKVWLLPDDAYQSLRAMAGDE